MMVVVVLVMVMVLVVVMVAVGFEVGCIVESEAPAGDCWRSVACSTIVGS